jgi:hypothetical protein
MVLAEEVLQHTEHMELMGGLFKHYLQEATAVELIKEAVLVAEAEQ